MDIVTLAAAKKYTRDYYDEHSGGQAIRVMNMADKEVFPTQRQTSPPTPLIIGDFVGVRKDQTLPIIVYLDSSKTTYMEFVNINDTASYDGDGGWMYNANPFQKTNETPVASKVNESLSGTAKYQNVINQENKTQIQQNTEDISNITTEVDGKVDKAPTSVGDKAYGVKNGVENLYVIDKSASASSIAQRYTGGRLKVGDAVDDQDSVNKKIMNESLDNKVDKDTSGADIVYSRINDADHNLPINKSAVANTVAWRGDGGTLKAGDPSAELDVVNKRTMNTELAKKVDRTVTETSGAKSTIDNQKGQHGAVLQSEFDDIISCVRTNDEDGADGILAQIYAKVKSTNIGARLNIFKNGIFYKVSNSSAVTANDELAVKGDVSSAVSTEKAQRTGADENLQNSIDEEAEHRALNDDMLRDELNSEVESRTEADTTITNTLTSHVNNKTNPHEVTKAQLGLGNVDNTSDVNKPVSTAQQTALDDAVAAEAALREDADDEEATARETKDDDLQEQINNLSSMGRYLSTWNCVTGKPATDPTTPLPYNYKAGDYYIINGVGVTNYRPSGTQYTGAASTTVETESVANNGYYQFDGATWIYLEHTSKSVGFKDLTGTARENTDLKNELNAKQDVLTAGDAIEIDTSNKISVKTSTAIPEEGQVDTKVPTEKAVAEFVYNETGNYLPLSGGEMTGAITSSKTEFLALGADMGAAMNLYGGERGGKFEIATKTTELIGNDSSLKWGDKEVLREDMITHDSSTGIITFNF